MTRFGGAAAERIPDARIPRRPAHRPPRAGRVHDRVGRRVPVAVANVGSAYHAFQNLCPLQGTTLGGRPIVDGRFLVCSQHSSRYDVTTGECVHPAEGDGFAQDLMVFETEVVDDVVRIRL
ncbi:MAG TPA: Rieske 2Fe-2S domain-containing protein [Acidimicrobiia bacterium]